MTKDVLLSISGLQFAAQDEEDVEPVEVITAGPRHQGSERFPGPSGR